MRAPTAKLPLVALALTLPLASGCQKSTKDRLQGQWRGDVVENVPEQHRAQTSGWARSMHFEFQGNKVKVKLPAEEPRSGSYQVVRQEGDRVTLAFQRDDGFARDEATFRLQGDKLRWELGDGRAVLFRRE